jgi:hypothetical protein
MGGSSAAHGIVVRERISIGDTSLSFIGVRCNTHAFHVFAIVVIPLDILLTHSLTHTHTLLLFVPLRSMDQKTFHNSATIPCALDSTVVCVTISIGDMEESLFDDDDVVVVGFQK